MRLLRCDMPDRKVEDITCITQDHIISYFQLIPQDHGHLLRGKVSYL